LGFARKQKTPFQLESITFFFTLFPSIMHCDLSAEQEQIFELFKESLNKSIDHDFPRNVNTSIYYIVVYYINSFDFYSN
jgi:hypothetical protein